MFLHNFVRTVMNKIRFKLVTKQVFIRIFRAGDTPTSSARFFNLRSVLLSHSFSFNFKVLPIYSN